MKSVKQFKYAFEIGMEWYTTSSLMQYFVICLSEVNPTSLTTTLTIHQSPSFGSPHTNTHVVGLTITLETVLEEKIRIRGYHIPEHSMVAELSIVKFGLIKRLEYCNDNKARPSRSPGHSSIHGVGSTVSDRLTVHE